MTDVGPHVICRLCKEQPAIQNSHILPEFMYRFVYDQGHRFVPFSTPEFQNARIEQKGYREPLLCSVCESRLSRWEAVAASQLDRLANDTPAAVTDQYELYMDIEYHLFKRAILSVVWRMGVAAHDAFKFYDLGPYSETIRNILHQDTEIDPTAFPVMLTRVAGDGQTNRGMQLLFKRMGRAAGMSVQSFVAHGFLYDVFMTEDKFPAEWEIACLNPSGKLGVRILETKDLVRGRNVVSLEHECNQRARRFYGL